MVSFLRKFCIKIFLEFLDTPSLSLLLIKLSYSRYNYHLSTACLVLEAKQRRPESATRGD